MYTKFETTNTTNRCTWKLLYKYLNIGGKFIWVSNYDKRISYY